MTTLPADSNGQKLIIKNWANSGFIIYGEFRKMIWISIPNFYLRAVINLTGKIEKLKNFNKAFF